MSNISKKILVLGCGLVVGAISGFASPQINNWDGMGDAGNVSASWTVAKDIDATGSMSGTPNGSTLTLTLVGGGGLPTFGTVTTLNAAFVGSYTTLGSGTMITFDLTGGTPGALSLVFNTTSYGVWMFDFGQVGVNQLGATTHFSVDMATLSSYWFADSYGSPSQQNFADAQADMTYIGLAIAGATAGTDTYYFDNFKIEGGVAGVPEPETVWMMIAVLASLAVTFRSRIKSVLGSIKA